MSADGNQRIDDWLAHETPEAVLEPDLPIIDPHHHLWDIRGFKTEPYASFEQKQYLCQQITDDIRGSGHHVTHTVFAQCGAFYRADGPEEMRCVGETEFAHGVAAMSRSGLYGSTRVCAGIFSAADLRLGEKVEPVLQAHRAASPNFRGIRTAFPRDLNDTFMRGYHVLGRLGLVYDNWSPEFDRLETLARLARANTDVTVIVNHLGGRIDADASADEVKRWQRGIDAVAACPNTVLKCGGAQMRVGEWEPAFHMHRQSSPASSETLCTLLLPRYRYAIEKFGPDRCMFESNFPVDRECVSYRTLWNLFKRIAAAMGLSAAEKAAIFSGTAKRAYSL